ncbi:unnamed protein product, partial [Amoebophrya sp. A25]|eukprot:GSA25T00026618001.1
MPGGVMTNNPDQAVENMMRLQGYPKNRMMFNTQDPSNLPYDPSAPYRKMTQAGPTPPSFLSITAQEMLTSQIFMKHMIQEFPMTTEVLRKHIFRFLASKSRDLLYRHFHEGTPGGVRMSRLRGTNLPVPISVVNGQHADELNPATSIFSFAPKAHRHEAKLLRKGEERKLTPQQREQAVYEEWREQRQQE